jgi:hypothetical protein
MFGILLDSGVEMLARHYATREEARTALAREQKARGDLVSLAPRRRHRRTQIGSRARRASQAALTKAPKRKRKVA